MSAPTGIEVNTRWGLEFGTFREFADDDEIVPYAVFRGFVQEVYEWEGLPNPVVDPIGTEGALSSLNTKLTPGAIPAIYGVISYIVENIDYTYDYNSRANINVATVEYRLSAEYAAVWEDGVWKQGPKMSKGGDPDWQEWLDEQD